MEIREKLAVLSKSPIKILKYTRDKLMLLPNYLIAVIAHYNMMENTNSTQRLILK